MSFRKLGKLTGEMEVTLSSRSGGDLNLSLPHLNKTSVIAAAVSVPQKMAVQEIVQRTRSQNFSDEEKNILLTEVEARQNCILGGGKVKPPKKVQSIAWKEVATVVSTNSTVRRTVDQRRKKLHDLIEVSMDASDGDGEELAAASEIPERGDEEGIVMNISQQCGTAAAAEEGEECQESKMSELEDSVGDTAIVKVNDLVCEEGEACDVMAAVVEGGLSESSGVGNLRLWEKELCHLHEHTDIKPMLVVKKRKMIRSILSTYIRNRFKVLRVFRPLLTCFNKL
ncbi:uncharacterized protein LOC121291789 isoform X2 [Carcharodon carcharias]|uniref:uncharacterized protein LOC121291789 isoform X2 n=1 Tax=Carcharodon carcharias TaxID=13397 RepID=UPI001B7F0AF0|nr:uncharacterized protein LOC121291789 isoform X2 [Carcharodon carcharias]